MRDQDRPRPKPGHHTTTTRPRRAPIDDLRGVLPERAPVPLVVGIATLLGSWSCPSTDDATARDAWLTAKADLLDRVALAAATPDLAEEARACAAAARCALGTGGLR